MRTELANQSHLAVVTSPFTAEELQSHSRVPVDRLRVVPLGVDVEAYASPADAVDLLALRKHSEAGRQTRALLYVGRIAGNKRIDLLIDALAQLAH